MNREFLHGKLLLYVKIFIDMKKTGKIFWEQTLFKKKTFGPKFIRDV